MTEKREVYHDPRHVFDCGRCKFSWCCGPTCACILKKKDLMPPPSERILEVAQLRIDAGLRPSAETLLKEYNL